MKTLCVSVLAMVLGCLVGCETTAVERFYVAASPEQFTRASFCRVLHPTDDNVAWMSKKDRASFVVLGHSRFQAPPQDEQDTIAFGRSIGANLVLLETNYLKTVRGVSSRTVYGSSYSQTDDSASAVVRDGWGRPVASVDANGRSQTQTIAPVGIAYDSYEYDLYRYDIIFIRDPSSPGLEAAK